MKSVNGFGSERDGRSFLNDRYSVTSDRPDVIRDFSFHGGSHAEPQRVGPPVLAASRFSNRLVQARRQAGMNAGPTSVGQPIHQPRHESSFLVICRAPHANAWRFGTEPWPLVRLRFARRLRALGDVYWPAQLWPFARTPLPYGHGSVGLTVCRALPSGDRQRARARYRSTYLVPATPG
jgi:hypothetical protein